MSELFLSFQLNGNQVAIDGNAGARLSEVLRERLDARDVKVGFEGEPDRFGVFQKFARTGHIERSLFVWFGRPHPKRRQLARATAELRTVR